MTELTRPDRDQVEAFAAQGYSLMEIARLVGSDKKTLHEPVYTEAFQDGNRRWVEVGQPAPEKVANVIARRVLEELGRRGEMTRPQLRDALGVDYSEIQLALDRLEGEHQVSTQDGHNDVVHYRLSGQPSPAAEDRRKSRAPDLTIPRANEPVSTIVDIKPPPPPEPPAVNNGGNELSQEVANPSPGSAIVTNNRGKLSARSPDPKPVTNTRTTSKTESGQTPTSQGDNLDNSEDIKVSDSIPSLKEIEEAMAELGSVSRIEKKFEMTRNKLHYHKSRNPEVKAAVERGFKRYLAAHDGQPPTVRGGNNRVVPKKSFEQSLVDLLATAENELRGNEEQQAALKIQAEKLRSYIADLKPLIERYKARTTTGSEN